MFTAPSREAMRKIECCLAEFERILLDPEYERRAASKDEASDFTNVFNQRDRFKLWLHDIEISDDTLDQRISTTQNLRDHILSLLDDLLQELISPEIPSNLEEITDIIDNLIRVGGVVREPARWRIKQKSSHETSAVHYRSKSPWVGIVSGSRVVAEWFKPGFRAVSAQYSLQDMFADSDVDIIALTNPILPGKSGNDALLWLDRLLPGILRDNNINAMVRRHVCPPGRLITATSTGTKLDLSGLANEIVERLNRSRRYHPERPLVFIGHGIGSVLAREVIVTLVREGISVSSEHRPITALMSSSLLDRSDRRAKHTSRRWIRQMMRFDEVLDSGHQVSDTDLDGMIEEVHRINQSFLELNMRLRIPQLICVEGQPSDHGFVAPKYILAEATTVMDGASTIITRNVSYDSVATFNGKDRDDIMPIAHSLARHIHDSLDERKADDPDDGHRVSRAEAKSINPKKLIGDDFAMLLGYNTAILINDSAAMSEHWSSLIELVRDIVDIACNYVDDVDIQLYNQRNSSFAVAGGTKAAMILQRTALTSQEWSLRSQLRHYWKRRYASSASSLQQDGKLRPCNAIVLTAFKSTDPLETLYSDLLKVLEECEVQKTLEIDLHLQIVVLGLDSDVMAAFDILRAYSSQIFAPRISIASNFQIPDEYRANSSICKRVLLGAISSRFDNRSARDFQHRSTQIEADAAAASAASSTIDDSEFWSKPSSSTVASSIGSVEADERDGLVAAAVTDDLLSKEDVPRLVTLFRTAEEQLRTLPGNFQNDTSQQFNKLFINHIRDVLDRDQFTYSEKHPSLRKVLQLTNEALSRLSLGRLRYPNSIFGYLQYLREEVLESNKLMNDYQVVEYFTSHFARIILKVLKNVQRAPLMGVETLKALASMAQLSYISVTAISRSAIHLIERDHSSLLRQFPTHEGSSIDAPSRVEWTTSQIGGITFKHYSPVNQELVTQVQESTYTAVSRPKANDSDFGPNATSPYAVHTPRQTDDAGSERSQGQSSVLIDRESEDSSMDRPPFTELRKASLGDTTKEPRNLKNVVTAPSASNSSDTDANPIIRDTFVSESDSAWRPLQHPITFACHLCTKQYTRAYNLRTHLHTHTEIQDRPHVCKVCSKAFSRLHDLRRHEKLHTVESKLVCRGELPNGAHWGCGRRFTRFSGLARHFRSAAGRICLQPLRDEERRERVETEMKIAERQGADPPQDLAADDEQSRDSLKLDFPLLLLKMYPRLANLDQNELLRSQDSKIASKRDHDQDELSHPFDFVSDASSVTSLEDND